MFLKRNNDELKADRPTLEENNSIPKLPFSFLLENIRSVHNVGSVFRTGDGIGCKKIYLSGSLVDLSQTIYTYYLVY